jgi:hypothetical protein
MQVLLSDFIEVEIKIRDRSNVTVVSQLDSRVVLGVDGSGALSSRELAGLAVVARPSPGRSRELAGNAVEAGRVQAQLLNQVDAQPDGSQSVHVPQEAVAAESIPNRESTLVVLTGQPRGGELAWHSLRVNVLEPLHADLAVLF